jgi:hypothetical protein
MRVILAPLVLGGLLVPPAAGGQPAAAPPAELGAKEVAEVNRPFEVSFTARKAHPEEYRLVVDAVFSDPSGRSLRVPAFWAGGKRWTVRFAADLAGSWRYRTECEDASDTGLHGIDGTVKVVPYKGNNPLLRHGRFKVSDNGRYLMHQDGTPFFWLGDTWWSLMTSRVSWPEGFTQLGNDRKTKGYTLVQTVIGFNPETDFDDVQNVNEGGQPWISDGKEYVAINPKYFDAVDKRIQWLVDNGIAPCIVGSWGYHRKWLSVERLKAHWRYLIARYGAYPVFWCAAGEVMMTYEQYLGSGTVTLEKKAGADWSLVAKHIRTIDPYHHPLTAHPAGGAGQLSSWANIEPDLLDFHMIQPAHDLHCIVRGIQQVKEGRGLTPVKPVVNAEQAYEGHLQSNYQNVVRLGFWTGFLAGNAGHTYGAAGIFNANDRERPVGNRPHVGKYDDITWDEAMQYPGSGQVGLGKKLLCRYEWWRFEPHPEWAALSNQGKNPESMAHAAGIPGKLRIIYIPTRIYSWTGPVVKQLERDVRYRAFYFDPIRAKEYKLGEVKPEGDGTWQAPMLPVCQDWVLVLEAQ